MKVRLQTNNFKMNEMIDTEFNPLPFNCIYTFPYSCASVLAIKNKIISILSNVECLTTKYDNCLSEWRCSYGTPSLKSTLIPEQIIVYERKNYLLRTGCILYFNIRNKEKINFRTVYTTQKMGVPFNYFQKKGITEQMRRNILK